MTEWNIVMSVAMCMWGAFCQIWTYYSDPGERPFHLFFFYAGGIVLVYFGFAFMA